MKAWMLRASLAVCTLLVSACGDDSDAVNDAALALVGNYDDNWDEDDDVDHEITETTWTNGDAVYHIKSFDNGARWIVAQNDDGNEFNPGKFSRFDWTRAGSKLYYCQIAYAAESEAEAKATAPADASDLDGGCADFSWTELFKK